LASWAAGGLLSARSLSVGAGIDAPDFSAIDFVGAVPLIAGSISRPGEVPISVRDSILVAYSDDTPSGFGDGWQPSKRLRPIATVRRHGRVPDLLKLDDFMRGVSWRTA
jgi:hypothetical protein